MSILSEKFKEVLYSVLPITGIVLILHMSLTPLEFPVLVRFLLGAVCIIIGLAVFLIGVDISVTPIGSLMGSGITKINKIWVIGFGGLLLGFFIAVAEPDLHILAGQVDLVTSGLISKLSIVVVVSLGIGILLALGLLRIVYNFPLYKGLTILYGLIFILSLFISPEFLAISFDASGATTGAMTVPFILALALGISSMKKNSKASEEDSFGLVAIASAGAILGVALMGVVSKTGQMTGSLESEMLHTNSIFRPFFHEVPIMLWEVFLALLPLLIIFLISQRALFHLPKARFWRIFKGLIYTYLGLVLFLVGVNAGFMDVGAVVGYRLAMMDNKFFIISVGFILGAVTIMAEPAVYVLNQQIEHVTSGYVKRRVVLVALAIGVGVAVTLSIVRILVPAIQLWHYLLPGYIISITLSFIVPQLFVGIGFDSGGVASGPMTATFILAFAHGAADAVEGATVLIDGFGVIAMVAMMPIIALQILGLIFKIKSGKGGMNSNGKQLQQ